jgi:hypothetical protein
MMGEELGAAGRWIFKWLAAAMEGRGRDESETACPADAAAVLSWPAPKCRAFLVARKRKLSRLENLPAADAPDPFGLRGMTPVELKREVRHDHAKALCAACWNVPPLHWQTDVRTLRRQLISAHNLFALSGTKVVNANMLSAFELRRKAYMRDTEAADKLFRDADAKPQTHLLLRKSMLAELPAHAREMEEYHAVVEKDEADGEKFVQKVKDRFGKSNGKGGASKQAETAERVRNLERWGFTMSEAAQSLQEAVDPDQVTEWTAVSTPAHVGAELRDDGAATSEFAIAEELADRRGSRRPDVTVHSNLADISTGLETWSVMAMWRSLAEDRESNVLYAEVVSQENRTFYRKLCRMRMDLVEVDSDMWVYWMKLRLDGPCVPVETCVTPLRLEPVLLLRKLPTENGTTISNNNKWWVLGTDRAEYRNGRWDYA